MALKRSRPEEDGDSPGLVVFVARRPEELARARAALAQAGVPLAVAPEAEAALAAGRALPLRVAPADLRRAQDALDEAFPIGAPGAPPEEEEAASPSPAEVSAALALDSDDEREAPPRDGPLLDEPIYEYDRSGTRDTRQRLEASAGKLLFIAAGSLAVPGIGALFGGFAAASAPLLLRRIEHERGRRLAWGALGIGLLSIGWNGWLGWMLLTKLGHHSLG